MRVFSRGRSLLGLSLCTDSGMTMTVWGVTSYARRQWHDVVDVRE